MIQPSLLVRGLSVAIATPAGTRPILSEVDFQLHAGEILGVVGESGSGKTMLMRSVMNILPASAQRTWQECRVAGVDITSGRTTQCPAISMIFQDPMTSLNPLRRIGFHLTEVIARWQKINGKRARSLAVEALERVGIPQPERRLKQYPHELSGGMRQRVMIAMALLAKPQVLIADEPTTALDVTVQAQILDTLAELQREEGLSVVLVTHDLGVVAGLCSRVNVMHHGEIVEDATVDDLFYRPQHPYTQSLLSCIPNGTPA